MSIRCAIGMTRALARPHVRKRWPLTCIGLLLSVGVVEFLTMPAGFISLDQTAWHEEARGFILHGTPAVDDARVEFTPWAYVVNPRDGQHYSKYGLLNGLMHVPALAIEYALTGDLPAEKSLEGKTSPNPVRTLIIDLFFVLLSVGIAALPWLVSAWYVDSHRLRAMFVLMTIYCTTLWYYLRFPLSEAPQVALFLLFWLFLLRFSRRDEPVPARPRRDVYWAWFALFLLCQTRVADLFIMPVFAAYLAYLSWQSDLSRRGRLRFGLTTILLPAALIVAVQGYVHFIKFGSPFLSGYHQYWEPPNPHTVWQVLWEFTIHPEWSVFITFPVLILALPGWWTYLRRHTAEALFFLALLLGMFDIVEPLPFCAASWLTDQGICCICCPCFRCRRFTCSSGSQAPVAPASEREITREG